MEKKESEKLFQPFSKIKSSHKLNKQGVGLGLNICKKLTEQMGGTIEVESLRQKGTKFTFKVKVLDYYVSNSDEQPGQLNFGDS